MRGVTFNKQTGKWRAVLKQTYLGEYTVLADAEAARRAAEIRAYGAPCSQAKITIEDTLAKVPFFGRGGVFRGWALIDAADVSIAQTARWSRLTSGYIVGRNRDGFRFLHRLILPCVDGRIADHINGDKLDCRRSNLRLCTHVENSRNAGTTKGRQYKGVGVLPCGRFRARIMVNRKEIALGWHDTASDAARAYDAAALRYFGEFARLNFPTLAGSEASA